MVARVIILAEVTAARVNPASLENAARKVSIAVSTCWKVNRLQLKRHCSDIESGKEVFGKASSRLFSLKERTWSFDFKEA